MDSSGKGQGLMSFDDCLHGSCTASHCSMCGNLFKSIFGKTFGRHHCRCDNHVSRRCTYCGKVPLGSLLNGNFQLVYDHLQLCSCSSPQWGCACDCAAICLECSNGSGESRKCCQCDENECVRVSGDEAAAYQMTVFQQQSPFDKTGGGGMATDSHRQQSFQKGPHAEEEEVSWRSIFDAPVTPK